MNATVIETFTSVAPSANERQLASETVRRLAQVGTPDELWNDPADTYVARLVGLSVLGGRAFRPEDIHATPDGSWDAVVTGRTFRDGHHLITARVDEESVVFVSQVPLETGDEIRLAAD